MEIGAGANLGRYQLLAEIGRGAMGTVYQALDPEIDRLVAIKTFSILDVSSSEGQAFLERFAQEARAAGRLMHPGIVTIYDVGEEPSTEIPYIVMEYVAGRPLSQLLAGSAARLEESFALRVAKDVAEALAYAHEKGVVHRDVKPANILITEDGNAKIADFGVARLDLSNLTVNGEVFGTPAYMAPEQITGGVVDGRCDLFSLGVILYTMLIGFRPFQGNSAHTIGFKVVNQEPVPITSFLLDLSKDTEYVVARAMAKDPSARYQTGTAFAQDLDDILNGRQLRDRRESNPPVSAEVFRIPDGYRPFKSMKSDEEPRPKHTSVFSAAPASGNVSAPAPAPSTVVRKLKPDSRLRAPTAWPSGRGLAPLALVVIAALGAFYGLYAERLQRNALRSADAHIGMPPVLPEHLPVAAVFKRASKRTIQVSLPEASTEVTRPKQTGETNLDYTIIHTQRKSQVTVPVMLAAVSVPAPAAKTSVPVPATITLALVLQHRLAEAELSVWVDNKLSFSETVLGKAKKRLLVLPGGAEGNESHEIHFPSGPHEVKVRVSSPAAQYDYSGSLRGTFLEGKKPILEIHCMKQGITLKLTRGF